MKTKAIVVDLSNHQRKVEMYGDYRIFVFDDLSLTIIINYLDTLGVDTSDIDKALNSFTVGEYWCEIIANMGVDKVCIENLSVILDNCIVLELEDYDGKSYSNWIPKKVNMDDFIGG